MSGGVDLAKSVIVPLLTREGIDFLHAAGSAEERHLWVTLGDGWTKCRYCSVMLLCVKNGILFSLLGEIVLASSKITLLFRKTPVVSSLMLFENYSC